MTNLDVIYQPRGRAAEYSPWACNLLDGLCPHRCRYCFVPKLPQSRRKDFDPTCRPKRDILARLERDCEKVIRAGGWPEDAGSVLLCFTCDPLPAGREDLWAITEQAIWELTSAGVPVTLLTKNGQAAIDRALPLLHPDRDTFATSLSFYTDGGANNQWEPYAPSPDTRWQALREATHRGIPTWVSIEPVIDTVEALEVIGIGQQYACVGHYKIGPLNHHPHAKTIDWPAFGEQLAEVLVETEARYYLKRDMRPHMPEGFPWCNVPELLVDEETP